MFELIKQQLSGSVNNEEKVNRLREFLQILILKIMFDRKIFDSLAFVGGTALRILHDLHRYSEDLDFSVVKKKDYSFKNLIESLFYELNNYGLDIELGQKKETNIVNTCMIKFPGLLKSLGISRNEHQKVSIRIEIDTNPPAGWKTSLSPVSKSFIFAIKHYDLPSLYSTKLHACFFRRYTKGRDFYDLLWYLGRKTIPNFTLLNNAIKQTEKKKLHIGKDNFKKFLLNKLSNVNFTSVRKDLERFIEDKNELKLLNKNIITQLVSNIDY